ncbi:class I SAM-dependent methyltransferase [Kutzneria sp. NPDC052558]|uniref:class I SAM-dependent methyltransferase n=1 Tax=Kutzneria sp. NPDC052558 TaxID=3364121 RepID=UPI0037C74AC2
MNEETFGLLHANHYDLLHPAKDYAAEVGQLRELFDREGPVESVVDLGCGTGRHLDLLAAEGFRVLGVDRSEAMADQAAKRLARHGDQAEVTRADIIRFTAPRRFDAAIMMFSLLGYQVSNVDTLAALAAARRQLRPGGLFAFDLLDAAAVLGSSCPPDGLAVIDEGPDRLLCGHSTAVDLDDQVLDLRLRMWLLRGEEIVDRADERHRIRLFGEVELALLLRAAGFEPVGSAPQAGDRRDSSRDWFRLVWARRIEYGGDHDGR